MVMFAAKRCKACGQSKAPEMFHAKSDAGDGLHPYCKACQLGKGKPSQRARTLAHRWLREAHPEEWMRLLERAKGEVDDE